VILVIIWRYSEVSVVLEHLWDILYIFQTRRRDGGRNSQLKISFGTPHPVQPLWLVWTALYHAITSDIAIEQTHRVEQGVPSSCYGVPGTGNALPYPCTGCASIPILTYYSSESSRDSSGCILFTIGCISMYLFVKGIIEGLSTNNGLDSISV